MSSISTPATATTATAANRREKNAGWFTHFCRQQVQRKLNKIGSIQLTDLDRDGQSDAANSSLVDQSAGDHWTVHVKDPRFYSRAVFGGALGAAESYIHGEWDSDDLVGLLRVFVREIKKGFHLSQKLSAIKGLTSKLYHWARRNTRLGSRKNISAHYDLGNDFFAQMLDETMTYSSGCFPTETTTLREAQVEKYERLCQMLELEKSDHLLEIGTGWGGMAIHAATRYGCRVTTTTISARQFEYASEKIKQLGLQDQIQVQLTDYRDLRGQFDKAVSIEMIEAVGHKFLPRYFQSCSRLLKDTALFAFQAISMPDQAYRDYLRRADFIQTYVFPGSCCPALGALVNAYSQSDFRCERTDNIGEDYATTLRLWRENIETNLSAIKSQGYGEEFLRLWNYYLCYCEAGFAEKYLSNHQILLSKSGCQ